MKIKRKNKVLHRAAATTLALGLLLPTLAAAASAPVPIRETAKSMGAEVTWDQKGRTITVQKGADKLVFTVGKDTALLNGKTVSIGDKVTIVSNQALVPASLLNQLLGSTEVADSKDALFLAALQQGNGEEALRYVSPALKKAVTAAELQSFWQSYEQALGKIGNPISQSTTKDAVHTNVTTIFQAGQSSLKLIMRLNAAGEVDDLFINLVQPEAYQKPAYDVETNYTEQEITIGQGEFVLPGTLTLPKGEGPFPAVVLVHGSGMNDRDETIGGAKPLRDLAVGLAAEGIAVLRYDKVTYQHTVKIASDPKLTLKRETADDALAAVKLLKTSKSIDPSQIYVIGHSQGGFAVPLMTSHDTAGDIAGAVLLAAPSGKFGDVLVEQQHDVIARMKELNMDTTANEQNAAMIEEIVKTINDPKYSVDQLPEQFPLQPAYWFFESRDYKAAELAAKQQLPLLILQGENDFQVSMKQFNDWKSALKERQNVQFKSYPKMNHLLSAYDGISVGAEYYSPSNVEIELIQDIAKWIKDKNN